VDRATTAGDSMRHATGDTAGNTTSDCVGNDMSFFAELDLPGRFLFRIQDVDLAGDRSC
jgi:hypothetical protein